MMLKLVSVVVQGMKLGPLPVDKKSNSIEINVL